MMPVLMVQVLQQVAVKTFSPTLGSLGITIQNGKWTVARITGAAAAVA